MRSLFIRYPALRRIAFFFPIQLVLVHLKKNHLLLLFWLIFFGVVTSAVAPRYGIPYLFLNPEYLDNVSIWSYLIVGFSCGGFIVAYNISSYIMNAFRFPFLATLSNPFLKYCLNNTIIPGLFILVYIWKIFEFQLNNQIPVTLILTHVLSFILGLLIFLFISVTYFFKASKDIFKMFGIKPTEDKHLVDLTKKEQRDWHVETYLTSPVQIKLCRRFDHYEKSMLIQVFKQNHYIAAAFEVAAMLSLLILGFFREVRAFEIPAGASVFLLFTMFLMLTSALHSWLRGWSTTAFIVLIFILNYLFQFESFNSVNNAYGMNYKVTPVEFSNKTLAAYDNNHVIFEHDVKNTLGILEKWKFKNTRDIEKKPKLVLINTSGGGLRSTVWTYHVLQHADSVLNGDLLNHTVLMSGSSGGMVGAAFLRELYLRKVNGENVNIYHDSLVTNVSRDLLNPIAFSVAVNDLFFRLQNFKDGENVFSKDRAYAFENRLNQNTGNVLNKRLQDYRKPEEEAKIPMMVLTPTIINDGRKLLVSSTPVSYLAQNSFRENLKYKPLYNSIEYSRFFGDQDAGNLRFTTALRMNATFPYIMPVVTLPSEPAIEVMDAGIRDNYGLETSIKFLYTFREWIAENTSGVVFIQIRDRFKEFPVETNPRKTITGSLARPLGTFYGNTFYVQDFNQTQLLQYASTWFKGNIEVVDFQLRNETTDNISLSWHLTEFEKKKVLNSIDQPENQAAFVKLKQLFAGDEPVDKMVTEFNRVHSK